MKFHGRYKDLVKLWSPSLPNDMTWHSCAWSYTVTPSIHQTLQKLMTLLLNWTLLLSLTFLPNSERFPWIICTDSGMPTEETHSADNWLYMSHFGLACVLVFRLVFEMNHVSGLWASLVSSILLLKKCLCCTSVKTLYSVLLTMYQISTGFALSMLKECCFFSASGMVLRCMTLVYYTPTKSMNYPIRESKLFKDSSVLLRRHFS